MGVCVCKSYLFVHYMLIDMSRYIDGLVFTLSL